MPACVLDLTLRLRFGLLAPCQYQYQHLGRNAWLAVLRCELPADAYRRVLVKMHDAIIPAMPNPLLLADFLSASVDQGGLAYC
jgi:hypothetical protein